MDFPPEVFDAIVENLAIHEMAILALTSKAFKAYIEPHLYRKVHTRTGTLQDTARLVHLLQKRQEIIQMIKELVLDEYHPHHARRLLGIRMPNLDNLCIVHNGQPPDEVSEREKRALNRGLVQQPKLSNCESQWETRTFLPTFSPTFPPTLPHPPGSLADEIVVFFNINCVGDELYKLSREDACLFRQPNVKRFRLSYVDLSTLEDVAKT